MARFDLIPKSLKLEFAALFSEVTFGHGHAHYGYFPDGLPDEMSLQALGAAQHAYFEKLVATIGMVHGDVHRILDVGSGTGANARNLIGAGFEVTCVSPSVQMNAMARTKLPPGTEVIDAGFEILDTEARYDLCLFAESFHYIELQSALSQAAKYAEMGVVIFDYFRRNGTAKDHNGDGRSTHKALLDVVAQQDSFEVLVDLDVTDEIAPTFMILEHIKREKLAPFVKRLRTTLKRDHPLRARVFEIVLGRSVDRLIRTTGRSETFAQHHEYRLIALGRKD